MRRLTIPKITGPGIGASAMSDTVVKFTDLFKDVLGIGTHDARVWLEMEQPGEPQDAVTTMYYSPADARAIAAALLKAADAAETKVQS